MRKLNFIGIMLVHSILGGGGVGFFGTQAFTAFAYPAASMWPLHPVSAIGFALLCGVFYWVSRKWAADYYFYRKARLILAWDGDSLAGEMVKYAKDGRTPEFKGMLHAQKSYDHAPDCDCGEPDSQSPVLESSRA